MIDQDRLERESKWISYILAAVFGVGAIVLITCGGLFFMLATESGESTPSEAQRWFETVVQDDPSSFTDIQHYTDQGIDFSHHFRFRFTDVDDLTPIINHHGLTPTQNVAPMHLEDLPLWYNPTGVPANAPRFACGGPEPILMIVDPDAGIAYFELVHL